MPLQSLCMNWSSSFHDLTDILGFNDKDNYVFSLPWLDQMSRCTEA